MAMTNNQLAAAIAAIDQTTASGDDALQLIGAKCRALIVGYHRRFSEAEYQPLTVEEMDLSPLVNPDSNASSRTFRVAGILDVLAEYRGRLTIIDHKTTSQDITDPAGPYWRQLIIEGQVSHYMLLKWLQGIKVDDAVWDVMKKPGISPKKITKAEVRSVASLPHEYFGRVVSDEDVASVIANERETLAMYESRLIRDCTVERPEAYFQRRSVMRIDAELIEYARELWEHGQEILHARNTNRYARNSGACMLYGSPCKFLGICSGYDTPDSDKWVRKAQVHNELPLLEGDGREVITNSRIRCFQTCRRKHYYEYEMGIERVDEEEREALLFGTVWHQALAAWWSYLLKPENSNVYCNEQSPGTELGQCRSTSKTSVVG